MARTFREFVIRGNVVDLAIAVVIGAAFVRVVNSLVDDVIMPPIGLLLGNVDFTNLFVILKEGTAAAGPYASLADAKATGAVTLNYGVFITTVVTFLIVAWVVYMLARWVNRFAPPAPAPVAAPTRECPFCLSPIPVKAVKCAHCGSELPPRS
ncbi:MAG: large conductance mechanosensitive channel protein MscL [Gemmatimonadales bacterium]